MIIRHTVHMCRTLESARSLVRPWWMENCSTLISNVVDHYKAICHFGRALVAVLEFQKVLFLEAWGCMGCQWADYTVNHWVCHLCLMKKKKLCLMSNFAWVEQNYSSGSTHINVVQYSCWTQSCHFCMLEIQIASLGELTRFMFGTNLSHLFTHLV